jgi:hypothetical protein
MGSDAREARRTAGTQMVERQVAWLADKAKQLVADFDKKAPKNQLRSFDDVERLWQEIVEPALSTFQSMQPDPHGTGHKISEPSRWAINWNADSLYQGSHQNSAKSDCC